MPVSSASYKLEVEFVTGSYTDISQYCSRANIQRDLGDFRNGISEGRAQFILDNDDGRFSVTNSGSPYGSNLTAGKNIKLTGVYSSNSYQIFTGKTKRYTADHVLGSRFTNLECSDAINTVRKKIVNTKLFYSTKVSSIFSDVFASIGVNSYTVESINDNPPFASFDNIQAITAFNRLLQYGDYRIYCDGAGIVRVKKRNYDYTEPTAANYTEILGMTTELEADNLINEVVISGIEKTETDVRTIGFITNPIFISNSSNYSFWLDFQDFYNKTVTQVNSVISPVSSTDFLFNSTANGTGVDLTSTASLYFSSFGKTSVISISNATANAFWLTKFQVRGKIIENNAPFKIKRSGLASQAAYGIQEFNIDNALFNNGVFDGGYAENIILQRSDPRPTLTYGLKNFYPDILSVELSNLITVTESNAGLNTDIKWAIRSINHDIMLERGQEHTVNYVCEKSTNAGFPILILDSPLQSNLDVYRLGF